jgi:hypothetical protein
LAWDSWVEQNGSGFGRRGVPVVVRDDTEVWMQSLFARRRVESRWNGDEAFRVRLEAGGRRGAVCGGCDWVRAELEHDGEHAEEEAGGGFEQCGVEDIKQDGGASCDDASRDDDASRSGDEAYVCEGCGAREGKAQAY